MKINKGLFITATDTGVGKTLLSGGLGMVLKDKGYNVGVMKPVQSGFINKKEHFLSSDTDFLIKSIDCNDNPALITPYFLKEPLSPLVAAEKEGITINIEKIKKSMSILSARHNILIVEGIGGLMVPIKYNYFVSDLIKDFNFPTILVARPGLGTINHTLLSINYLKQIGAKIIGFVINYTEETKNGLAEITNPKLLEKLSEVPLLGILPYMSNIRPGLDNFPEAKKKINERIKKNLDIKKILKYIT